MTLSKHLPFTFVDHALKEGDSLVGVSMERIEEATAAAIAAGAFKEPPRSILQNLAKAREPCFGWTAAATPTPTANRSPGEQQQASDPSATWAICWWRPSSREPNTKARANLAGGDLIRELNSGMILTQ